MTLLQRLRTPRTWQPRKNSAAVAVEFTRKVKGKRGRSTVNRCYPAQNNVGIECYRNATHTNNVQLFFLRSTELMMDTRHTRLSWLGVEVYVVSAVKESRHASLYPAPRN